MDNTSSEDNAHLSEEEADLVDDDGMGEPHKKIKVEEKQQNRRDFAPLTEDTPDQSFLHGHSEPDKLVKAETLGGPGGPNHVSNSMSFKPRGHGGSFQPKPVIPSLEYESERDYRKEYHRIYLANVAIMDMINQTIDENNTIKVKITNLKSEKSSKLKTEVNIDDGSDSNNESGSEDFSSNRKRKRRRKKEEIKRDFVCSITECGKSYG